MLTRRYAAMGMAIMAMATAVGVAADLNEALAAGATWKGSCNTDDRMAKIKTGKATLKIENRTGNTFTATLSLNWPKGSDQKEKLNGEINKHGEITFVRAGGGVTNGITLPVQLDGEKMTFRLLRSNDKNAQGPTIEVAFKDRKR